MQNILVLTYFSFKDALIQSYTLPYVRIIRSTVPEKTKVFLFTIEKDVFPFSEEEKKTVKQSLSQEGIEWISMLYIPFGFRSLMKWMFMLPSLWTFILKKNIGYLHCWATPAGAAGYILSVFSGRKLIIDSYEPHAEAMVENGTWKREGLAFKILFLLEKLQSHRARVVIAAAASMRQYAQEKYKATFKNFFVKPACVDLELFSEKNIKNPALIKSLDLENKIICVYAGKFGGIYQEKEVFDFFKVAIDYWDDRFRVLLLTNQSDDDIRKYCNHSNVPIEFIIKKFVPHREVPDYMGLADFAITPVKPVATKKHCTPIKDGEYWALGLPVVLPANISDDSEIVSRNGAGAVLNGFTVSDYQKAISTIDNMLKLPKMEVFKNIRKIAEKHRSFNIAKEIYHEVYTKILAE